MVKPSRIPAAVWFNGTGQHAFHGIDGKERGMVARALDELLSLSPDVRRRMGNPMHRAKVREELDWQIRCAQLVAKHCDSGHLTIDPLTFGNRSTRRFADHVPEIMLRETRLGRSAVKVLAEHGVKDFIGRLKSPTNVTTYSRLLSACIASLCLSIRGVARLQDIPPDMVIDWVQRFREPNRSRWRTDVWNASIMVATQCLREVVAAYVRATGHARVMKFTKQKRSDAIYFRNWEEVQQSSPPHVQPLLALFNSWREGGPTCNDGYKQMFMNLRDYLDEHEGPEAMSDVRALLSQPRRSKVSFAQYLTQRPPSSSTKQAVIKISYVTYLAMARRFSVWLEAELGFHQDGARFYHLVTEPDIDSTKSRLQQRASNHEARSRPLPTKYYDIARATLEEGESGWPGKLSICRVTVPGRDERIYCPVLPTLFLALFHLPLRVGQMKRLDSGEGDLMRFDGRKLQWSENDNPNTGYWAKIDDPDRARGYAVRFDAKVPITGFFVNTNKSGAPYEVPWQNEALHHLFHDLRVWQETYNPIRGPIGPELYVEQADEVEEGKLDHYPDIFPLFRLPFRQ